MKKQIRRELDWVVAQELLHTIEDFPRLFDDSEFSLLFSKLQNYVVTALKVEEDVEDFYVVYEVEDKDEDNGTA